MVAAPPPLRPDSAVTGRPVAPAPMRRRVSVVFEQGPDGEVCAKVTVTSSSIDWSSSSMGESVACVHPWREYMRGHR